MSMCIAMVRSMKALWNICAIILTSLHIVRVLNGLSRLNALSMLNEMSRLNALSRLSEMRMEIACLYYMRHYDRSTIGW